MGDDSENPFLERPAISALGEADIDLLLVEEFRVSPEFRSWLLKELSGGEFDIGEFQGSWRSVSTNLGESDIVVLFKDGASGSTIALLIENKIRAEFQDRQPERYYDRGEEGKNAGWWDDFCTALIAPQKYLDGIESRLFDNCVSYESIHDCFAFRSADPRQAFKAKVVKRALDPGVRLWQRVPDPVTTKFFAGYEVACLRDFPTLRLKEKPERSAQDCWVYFHQAKGFPKGVYIIHKCDRGFVDLTYPNRSERELTNAYQGMLGPDMNIVQTGKSAAVRLIVDPLDHRKSFEDERDKVIAGLKAVERLRNFAEDSTSRS